MLRRLPIASRRASVAASGPRTAAVQSLISPTRNISFLPWKRKPQATSSPTPPLPVYFPRSTWLSPLSHWKAPLRRAVIATLICFTCYTAFLILVVLPVLVFLDEQWESLSEAEKEEYTKLRNEDDNLMFFPVPFTGFLADQPRYKPSDPEYKEFYKIMQSKALQREIKTDLIHIVSKLVARSPELCRALGRKDPVAGKQWLEFSFPARPPPKQYIQGFAIRSNGLYWTQQHVDGWSDEALNSVLYPKVVASAFWTFCSSLLKQNTQYISDYFSANASSVTRQSASSSQPSERAPTNRQGSDSDASKPPAIFTHLPSHIQILHDPSRAGDSALDSRVRAALKDALQNFQKTYRPVAKSVGRGCFLVDGIVEFEGKRLAVTTQVQAWYNPSSKNWILISIKVRYWRYMQIKYTS
ncbi:hypothetical protein XA68_11829 [Ophiocordyceps unilateralis]|uniref:Uncharacterized protein n=1 Tax=Ophiocordyceps unilateralis TaxID=268505 RepID=A0A2A9PPM1_OPHUN|nr:hypothetical protein XA68_11829 [Ophiocordyceps unilateralis]